MPEQPVRWWSLRPAQNLEARTYRCPLCGQYLPSLSEHTLLWPEGDKSRRRHAHTQCVLEARRAGQLPTKEEWRRAEPRSSLWERLRNRLAGARARDHT